MTRAVRERPRVAVASALITVAALATAAALGAALFGDSSVSAKTQAKLERTERSAAQSARALERAGDEVARLRDQLQASRARGRKAARASAQLRLEVRRLERALARAQPEP
jgi:chromosome segregation ATPase